MLKIKFIGTGSAKVSLKRNFTSLIFEIDYDKILIDCGDGITRALIQHKIELNSINKILISHLHSDHFSGLSTLLTQLKLCGRINPIEIFSSKENIPILKRFLYSSFIIPERMDFEIRFIGFDFEENVKLSKNLNFIARNNSHLQKYESYQKLYNLSLTSPSFLFSSSSKKIFYSSDIGVWEDLLLFAPPIDVLICEITHIKLDELKEVIKKLKPHSTLLIHIPDEKESEISNFLNQNRTDLGQIDFAKDGQEIIIE
ncbi:MBL fold metallo-hydrolase [Ignavibacterium sp.]|uniref:MBL fold metallo-hydrolase n=1 Tax=Ignavibacterium sp. TaxID=2651167 RepID=UPI00307EB31B